MVRPIASANPRGTRVTIGPIQNEESAPALAAPGDLPVERVATEHRSLQALTTAALVAGVAVLSLGPAAVPAIAGDEQPVGEVCVVTEAGDPVPDAVIERFDADDWAPIGSTGSAGCVAVVAATTEDDFAAVYGALRVESNADDLVGTDVVITLTDHRVLVFDTEGTALLDIGVRYFTDAWHDASARDGAATVISALEQPTQIEVMWQGARYVQPFSPEAVVELALVSPDADARITEIDRGAGWEPFVEPMEVLPGRFVVRLADGDVAKFEVPAGHRLVVPSGRLGQLDRTIALPTPEPAPTSEPEPTPTSEPTATTEPTAEPTATPEPPPTSEPTETTEPTPEPTPTSEAGS